MTNEKEVFPIAFEDDDVEIITQEDLDDALEYLDSVLRETDQLAEEKKQKVQALVDQLNPKILLEIDKIEASYTAQIDDLVEFGKSTETEIKAYILLKGVTYANDKHQAQYCTGRDQWDYAELWKMLLQHPDLFECVNITWDNKKLKAHAATNPDLALCRMKGAPYVQIKLNSVSK